MSSSTDWGVLVRSVVRYGIAPPSGNPVALKNLVNIARRLSAAPNPYDRIAELEAELAALNAEGSSHAADNANTRGRAPSGRGAAGTKRSA